MQKKKEYYFLYVNFFLSSSFCSSVMNMIRLLDKKHLIIFIIHEKVWKWTHYIRKNMMIYIKTFVSYITIWRIWIPEQHNTAVRALLCHRVKSSISYLSGCVLIDLTANNEICQTMLLGIFIFQDKNEHWNVKTRPRKSLSSIFNEKQIFFANFYKFSISFISLKALTADDFIPSN